jgi:hypothetical protein
VDPSAAAGESDEPAESAPTADTGPYGGQGYAADSTYSAYTGPSAPSAASAPSTVGHAADPAYGNAASYLDADGLPPTQAVPTVEPTAAAEPAPTLSAPEPAGYFNAPSAASSPEASLDSPIPASAHSARSARSAASAPSAPSAGSPAQDSGVGYSVRLTFSDGSSLRLSSDAVLGRKPQIVAEEENAVSVPLIDPLKSSSRVHLRMRLHPEGVSVEDAGSGNGTRVEHEGRLYDAQPGQPFWVVPGDTIWLGEVPVVIELG